MHEWNCWGAVRRAFAMGVFLGMLLFLVPLLVIGFILMLFLKEHPLATNVNHTGHPTDDSL